MQKFLTDLLANGVPAQDMIVALNRSELSTTTTTTTANRSHRCRPLAPNAAAHFFSLIEPSGGGGLPASQWHTLMQPFAVEKYSNFVFVFVV